MAPPPGHDDAPADHPGHGHGHGHAHTPVATTPGVRRGLITAVVACALATLIGLVVLWPSGEETAAVDQLGFNQLVDATVEEVALGPCLGSPVESRDCDVVAVRITSGPTAGDLGELRVVVSPSAPVLSPGDGVVLSYVPGPDPAFHYAFADFQRERPLLLLAGLFVVAVLLLGRLRGLGALAGLGASLGVLAVFVLPALLDGRAALPVALTGASVIAFIALYLAHGVNLRTTVALLGTFASLALTGVLALVFVGAAHFSGLADEEALYLQVVSARIDLRGVLLAGIVIGALGVLDDVTVTQVSAVAELRRARPDAPTREIYQAALRIGRDHISSTVNTLVLAYAGASLPLLLLFTQADQGFSALVTGEVVAVEVVRALVGSIGLVASVPITTALATLALSRPGPVLSGDPSGPSRPRRGSSRRGTPPA